MESYETAYDEDGGVMSEVGDRLEKGLRIDAGETVKASESVGVGDWTIVAVGRDRREALALLIERLSLTIVPAPSDDSSRSIVTRAEGATFEEMARKLCDALLNLVESEVAPGGLVFDGMVRTDEGYAGWGHLLLGARDTVINAPVAQELTATNITGGVQLTLSLRRSIKGGTA